MRAPILPQYERAPIDGRSFAAGQAFTLATKMYWTTRMYPALRERVTGDSIEAIEAELANDLLYRYFAWLERHLQRFKYSGRYGLHPWYAQQRRELEAKLGTAACEVDLSLAPPRYYASCDIHQHPGGLGGDAIAGFVYERGARSTTPMLGNRHKDLHDRFTAMIEADEGIERVLDMGCGFGKSTRPFAQALRQARIDAVDLSASCVRLAAVASAEAGIANARYRQMDARHTDYRPGEFDLVTSTMLIHEMPPPAIRETFAEAHRVLRPGGRMLHLDFYKLPDAFTRFIYYGHAKRNNEPFMPPLAEMDLEAELRALGFTEIQIEPFAEIDGALEPAWTAWRFPWTTISAVKA